MKLNLFLDNCGNFLHKSPSKCIFLVICAPYFNVHIWYEGRTWKKKQTKTSINVCNILSNIWSSISVFLFSFVLKWMAIIRRKLLDLRVDYYYYSASDLCLHLFDAHKSWFCKSKTPGLESKSSGSRHQNSLFPNKDNLASYHCKIIFYVHYGEKCTASYCWNGQLGNSFRNAVLKFLPERYSVQAKVISCIYILR